MADMAGVSGAHRSLVAQQTPKLHLNRSEVASGDHSEAFLDQQLTHRPVHRALASENK